MPARIELVNVTDLTPTKMTQVEQAAWLETSGIAEYYTVGSGKGGRVMVRPEDAEQVRTLPAPHKGRGGVRIVRQAHPIVQPPPKMDMEELEEWKSSIEEMVLEQEGQVSKLHQAVESMAQVYSQLKNTTTLDLPPIPELPSKYKYRIVICGGDTRAVNFLEPQFKDVRFIHVDSYTKKATGKQLPRADLALLLVKFMGHNDTSVCKAFYGDKAQIIHSGGLSTLQAVVETWLRNNQVGEAK